MTNAPPGDQDARDRIRRDLDTNMLVEAGAGAGKTSSLVGRMLSLVECGTAMENIAAVTFTKKAANELRERFQIELEAASRAASLPPQHFARYDRALRDIDRVFLGTIHSFCGRLLREHPLAVGLDPQFTEVAEEDWKELQTAFWRRWLERARRNDDADLVALRALALDVRGLSRGFASVVLYPDVHFPAPEAPLPECAAARSALLELMKETRELMPPVEPAGGWDPLMNLLHRLEFAHRKEKWGDTVYFCSVLERISKSGCTPVQKQWSAAKEAQKLAGALGDRWFAFLDGAAKPVLDGWREHRYPLVMRFLERAAREFERERHATGKIGFQDLLLLAARLLREHPRVRAELGAHYRHLLVDEFQDTDPVQAEVCFLLASDPVQGNDWRTVTPRPGALFVVGDPKQSIYRFRRADIQTYELVKQRLSVNGEAVRLTENFRSVQAIGDLVNQHFVPPLFPAEASDVQAAHSRMVTRQGPSPLAGVFRYEVPVRGAGDGAMLVADAALAASWIAACIGRGERKPGDFLLLTPTKDPIELYARALSERNVPVSTTGALLPQDHELRELLVVLHALADPEDPVKVVAALEGLFCGLTPAELYEAKEAGARFAITHPPAGASHPALAALTKLHYWWRKSQQQPADILIDEILNETGLLIHAASQPLGDARAGALLHIVETLRSASVTNGPGIVEAMDRLEIMLSSVAPDAPLRPGRADAVRVMNLHKAKGLEATVVMLVAPEDQPHFAPDIHIERGGEGGSVGALTISVKEGPSSRVVAQPVGWAAKATEEQRFLDAEDDRLLYVAATRARETLVVAQRVRPPSAKRSDSVADKSIWAPLAPTLATVAKPLILQPAEAPGRKKVTRTVESIEEAIKATEERRRAAAASSMAVTTVTESVKVEREIEHIYDQTKRGLGTAWGNAVHRAIEGLAKGRREAALVAWIKAVASEQGISEGQVMELQAIIESMERSVSWKTLADVENIQPELTVMRYESADGSAMVTDGVIDEASLGANGWRIIDWKTDAAEGVTWDERRVTYDRQVAKYSQMLSAVSGLQAQGALVRVRTGTEK